MIAVLLGLAVAASSPKGNAAGKTPPVIRPADANAVMAAVRAPGARAVLLNVWASWCEPCREEMPDLVRSYREHQKDGVRLVLVSADFDDARDKAAQFLGSLGVDFPSYGKQGNDDAFVTGIHKGWSGAIPATFLFDGQGKLQFFWPAQVTFAELEHQVRRVLSPQKRR